MSTNRTVVSHARLPDLHWMREDMDPWSTPICGQTIGPWYTKSVAPAEWAEHGCPSCKNLLDRRKVNDWPEGLPNAPTCGCCSFGCCCDIHQDVPMGRPPVKCAYHAKS